MFPLLFLAFVVAIKVFKKTTPNGKVTVYLGKRDFIDHLDSIDPIDGIVVVENDYLQGRKIYGQVTTIFRYGREEDEVMGVKFSRELVLCREQIVPIKKEKQDMTPVQERLLKRLGANAYPFLFQFPQSSPSSVTLQPGDDDQGKPLGVEYTVRIYVGEHEEDKLFVVQHCEVTMVNTQFSRHVASLETREGCPITPGASFTKQFYLVPLASSNKDRRGIALDGHLKDDDVNLASSTLVADGKTPSDAMGIVISYSIRVKLNCGTLGGELVTDVPFKLMHPAPGAVEKEKATLKKNKSIERARYENSCYSNDDDDNIVFEDFARLRLNEPE
ncbi:arrestin homolog isoform X2 [Frieseomelitta varia]|uniref:arrestin homolog isoform X2 n=1 Tax=Frieseomelitta varia TaxID=561572 RepID=UPI001CB685CA|nr:arrestin homolog isoform X2 [Frieseomelitta varia]